MVTDGLVFLIDAANTKSYPGTGATVTDIAQGVSGTKGTAVSLITYNGVKTFQFTSTDANNFISFTSGTNDYEFSTQSVATWINTTTAKTNMDFITGLNSGDGSDRWRHQTTNTLGAGVKGIELDWIHTEGWGYFAAPLTYDDGNWHYFVTTFDDGTNTGTLYWDGVEITITASSTTPDWTTGENINKLSVGGDEQELGSNFIGYMPLAKMYNRVLTGAEVLQNYNALKGRFGL